MNLNIHPIDLAIIGLYLVGIIAIGLWCSRRGRDSTGEYFLAGRSLGWGVIGLALFATNISTVHLVGLAADGYDSGLVIGNFEWMAAFCLIALSLIFAPFYFRNQIATLPEYLERRFSAGSRTFLAFMGVVGALFIHIGMSLYAGSEIIQQFLGIDIVSSIVIISAATALYTVVGGLKAVVVTESIQTVLLIFGAVAVTVLALVRLPDAGIYSVADLREAVKPTQLNMIHRDGGLSWYAILLGYPVLGIWYWCADQTIVQRVLGAKSERDAQWGPLLAGAIKVLPLFVMVLPGVFAYVLFREQIGTNPNQALPVLINELIPVGLKGLIAAGLLAALMSTIAGALNSAATLVSIDMVHRWRPSTTDRALVTIGRVTACVVMLLAMLWSTQGGQFESVFKGLNAMIACLAPPITTVFVWGVFWPRGTQQAALTTLTVGFGLGVVTFLLDFPPSCSAILSTLHGIAPSYCESPDPGFRLVTDGIGIAFMLQAWWLFVVCSVLFVAISLVTPKPRPEQTAGLCWANPLSALFGQPLTGTTDPRLLAALLATTMACLYWLFA